MPIFSGQARTPNQVKCRKNGFCSNQQTSYAPGSLQKRDFCPRWFEVRWVALCAEPGVKGESDDVTVRDAGVDVAAADPALELKNFRDGVVELSASGVPVFDDAQSVRMRRKSVIGRLELGVERVGDFPQSAGVEGVIRHESCSGRSG
ncbi:hypothetical protein [Streptomyces flaveus]|uniref:hypothetical protein n=1 Tax=Streptomyces flaveus TaxID=66370 RepID=UPI003319994D